MIRAAVACLLSAVLGGAALAPAAAAAPPNSAVALAAVSCATATSCSAVGGYDDALGDGQGLLVNEVRGHWRRAVQAQPPAGASFDPFKPSDGGLLADVACPGVGDCTAVGRYTDSGNIDHGVSFTEAGGHWARGVRMTLPRNAIAPGKPKSGVTDDLGLAAVACSSVGNCVAVGDYETDAEVWEPMIVVERGGRWSRGVEAPLPAGAAVAGQQAVLLTVTCASSGACTAAGEYIDKNGLQQGLLISGHDGSWRAAPAPAAPTDANGDPHIVPASIACADAGDCAAVGTYVNPLQNSLGLLLTAAGGAWAPATGATLPPNAAPASTVGDQTVVLTSVACPQAGECDAVGWYFDNDENGEGLLVGEHDGAWQPGAEVTLPANAATGLERQSAGLDWISCAGPGNCLATGAYTDAGYNTQGLLLQEAGGVWQTGLESPLPRNAGNVQYAAADQSDCTAAGSCTVIGEYNDRRGNVFGYVLSETRGSWGSATELALPAADTAEMKLSLDTILVPPAGKAARLAQIRRARRYVFEYPAVVAGTATVVWYGRKAGHALEIATGRARARGAGQVKLELHLTQAGAELLAGAKQVHVVATARFTAAGGHRPQSASASFTLS